MNLLYSPTLVSVSQGTWWLQFLRAFQGSEDSLSLLFISIILCRFQLSLCFRSFANSFFNLLSVFFFFLNIYIYWFIWLRWVLVAAGEICSCGLWDRVPHLGVPCPPVLGVPTLSHGPERKSLDRLIVTKLKFTEIEWLVQGHAGIKWQS